MKLAKEMADAGKANHMLPIDFEHVPINAQRFLSLAHMRVRLLKELSKSLISNEIRYVDF